MLQVEPEQLDLGRFERLVAEAQERRGAEQRSRLLREALALWRGPPLADLAFETFAQSEIRRLEELRLEALEERIDADLELGGGGELVGELEALVAEHPLRERLRGQLMLALYRAGRQAEALQAYHDARRALVDELGIEPGPALQQLYRSILRQEAALERARAAASPPRTTSATSSRRCSPAGSCPCSAPGVNRRDGCRRAAGPAEVAAHLAERFDCPPEHARDLAHVAEYVALTKGVGPLYDELHALFDRDCAPGPVHRAAGRARRAAAGARRAAAS